MKSIMVNSFHHLAIKYSGFESIGAAAGGNG